MTTHLERPRYCTAVSCPASMSLRVFAAVVATTACVIVGPGLPKLISLVARHLGPGSDDADLANFSRDQLGRAGRWLG